VVKSIQAFWKSEDGATAIEYALIAASIALLAISGMVLFANANGEKYDTITTAVTAASGGGGS
jgi:Flp pilus assembly pilin Flp